MATSNPYHEGELAIQQRVDETRQRVGAYDAVDSNL